MKKIGLRHRFCHDVDCRQCLQDHENFGRYLDEKTGTGRNIDHLGKFRMWIENQVSYQVETEWGWSHPDTMTQEYADAYIDDFLADEQDNIEEARFMTELEGEE